MPKILVIEDSEVIRDEIESILDFGRYQTIFAEDGEKGIELVKLEKPDLILCDIMMPKLNGYEVIKKIKSDPNMYSIPFIFLTAIVERENVRKCMNLGADDYLTKPFSAQELLKAIETRLEIKENKLKQTNKIIELISHNIMQALPHEIYTPLNGILGFSDLIIKIAKEDTEVNSQIREMALHIKNASLKLNDIFKRFMLYTKLEMLKQDKNKIEKLKKESFSYPLELIQSIAELTSKKYNTKLELKYNLSNNAEIKISKENLTFVLSEIIDNAFKFAYENSEVEIIAEIEDNNFVIRVLNYGRVMTKEQINGIGAYMQFDRNIYEQQGYGLGLAIAKKITEVYDGVFEIKSINNSKTEVKLKYLIK